MEARKGWGWWEGPSGDMGQWVTLVLISAFEHPAASLQGMRWGKGIRG